MTGASSSGHPFRGEAGVGVSRWRRADLARSCVVVWWNWDRDKRIGTSWGVETSRLNASLGTNANPTPSFGDI